MKGINKLFYRLDQIKRVVLWICLPVFLACFFLPVGFLALFTAFPLSIVGLFFALFPIHFPKNEEITQAILDTHKQYARRIAGEKGCGEEEILLLDGFSTEKAYLGRRFGTRMLYPVCRTVVFWEEEKGVSVFIKDAPLMTGISPKEETLRVTKEKPLSLTCEAKGQNVLLLSFVSDAGSFCIYLREKYKLKELLEKYKAYLRYESSFIQTL